MSKEFEMQLNGFHLVTAEILYRMPDHLDILQTFVWQHYDKLPRFPHLKNFLDFWQKHLDGPLFSIRVCVRAPLGAPSVPIVSQEWRFHEV